MNPIEHLWAMIDRKIRKKYQKPSSKEELLSETWQEIPQDNVRELINRLSKESLH